MYYYKKEIGKIYSLIIASRTNFFCEMSNKLSLSSPILQHTGMV